MPWSETTALLALSFLGSNRGCEGVCLIRDSSHISQQVELAD